MKTTTEIFQIGDWKILPGTNQVQNHQSAFFLKPRLMRLLVFLLENRNRIVTKDEVMDAVWEGRIVTDNLLAKSISELRQIIEEHFPGLMEIETIRSVGYEFRNHEKVERTIEGIASTTDMDDKEAKANNKHFHIWVGILLFSVLLAVSIYWKINTSSPSPTATKYEIDFSPLTSITGMEWHAALSPEGANLVYAWRKNQTEPFKLYTRHLDASTSRRLTTSEDGFELNPAWSPDGQKVAFLAPNKKSYDLMITPLAGGEAEFLAKLDFVVIRPGIKWDEDGKGLMFSAKKNSESPSAIYYYRFADKSIQQLTHPSDTIYGDQFPCLLPNRKIAFVRSLYGKSLLNPKASGDAEVMLVDEINSEIWTLANIKKEVTGMDYSPILERLCISSASQEGYEYDISSCDLSGNVENIANIESFRPVNINAHPKEPFVIFEAWNSKMNIYKINKNELTPYIHSTHWDWSPRFSADGKKVAFVSARNGPIQIWMSNHEHPDSAFPVSEEEFKAVYWISLSPDAGTLLVQGDKNGKEGIYMIDVKTKTVKPYKVDGNNYAHPEFSLDGQTIYYASNKTGDWQLWKNNQRGDMEKQLTSNGGFKGQPIVQNGKEYLYYVKFAEYEMFKMDVESKNIEQLAAAFTLGDKMNFVIHPSGLYYYKWNHGRCYLRFANFDGQEVKNLMMLSEIIPEVPSLAISPEGEILISKSDKIESDLVKMEIKK